MISVYPCNGMASSPALPNTANGTMEQNSDAFCSLEPGLRREEKYVEQRTS